MILLPAILATTPVIAASTAPAAPKTGEDVAFAARIRRAEQLIKANRPDEARAILEELETQRPADSQTQFLLALLDLAEKDFAAAIERYHRILVREPNAVRVRLELGRAYFENGDYGNAERQFRFARAGKLPPEVVANVDRFLNTIRARKTFSYGFSFAVVPDSNLNAGPATDTVSLYGVPFQLSQNAQANSGVGFALGANAEWAPRIGKQTKFRVGGQVHRVQYLKTDFDDMTVSAFAGPRVNLKRWEFNAQANFAHRWYGNRAYSRTVGGGVDGTYFINNRAAIGAGLILHHADYLLNPLQTGMGHTVTFNAFYTPTPSSFVTASARLGRQDAKDPALAFRSRQFALQYVHELKGGFTVGIAPTYTHIAYDAPLAAFGTVRVDRQVAVQTTLLNRRIYWRGLTPRIGYTYINNSSSIPLFSFSRNRFEIGLTSSF